MFVVGFQWANYCFSWVSSFYIPVDVLSGLIDFKLQIIEVQNECIGLHRKRYLVLKFKQGCLFMPATVWIILTFNT